jgi:hypothetical protein
MEIKRLPNFWKQRGISKLAIKNSRRWRLKGSWKMRWFEHDISTFVARESQSQKSALAAWAATFLESFCPGTQPHG